MKRTLIALGLFAGLACAPVASPAPAAALVQTEAHADGIALGATTRCVAPGAARAVLAARSLTTVAYSAAVNGRVVKTGSLRPDATRTVAVVVVVPDARTSRVVLRLAGRAVVNALVTPHCAAPAPVVAPVTPPAPVTVDRGSASSYALHSNSNGTVTRWNPCAGPISVRVNAPADAQADVLAALTSVEAATGLDLAYAGATDFVPTSTNAGTQPADLVIAWASRAASDIWSGSEVGVGGWRSRGTSSDGGATWTWSITSGFVIVDPAAAVAPGFGRGATRGALLLHELAHALGLGHVSDPLQVMNPSLLSTSYGSYGTGDLAGLAQVGAAKGCTAAA